MRIQFTAEEHEVLSALVGAMPLRDDETPALIERVLARDLVPTPPPPEAFGFSAEEVVVATIKGLLGRGWLTRDEQGLHPSPIAVRVLLFPLPYTEGEIRVQGDGFLVHRGRPLTLHTWSDGIVTWTPDREFPNFPGQD